MYGNRRNDIETILFALNLISGCDLFQLCAQVMKDGAMVTRKVMYFVVHPGGGVGGTSVRKRRHFGVEVHILWWEME